MIPSKQHELTLSCKLQNMEGQIFSTLFNERLTLFLSWQIFCGNLFAILISSLKTVTWRQMTALNGIMALSFLFSFYVGFLLRQRLHFNVTKEPAKMKSKPFIL